MITIFLIMIESFEIIISIAQIGILLFAILAFKSLRNNLKRLQMIFKKLF